MARSAAFNLRRCSIRSCGTLIHRRHIVCARCWLLAPKWSQQKVTEQLNYGRAYHCHPTQEYLEARVELVRVVTAKREERYAKPAPNPQLPLLPAT